MAKAKLAKTQGNDSTSRAATLPHWAPIRFRTAPFTLSTAQEGLKFEQGQTKERENEDMDYFKREKYEVLLWCVGKDGREGRKREKILKLSVVCV